MIRKVIRNNVVEQITANKVKLNMVVCFKNTCYGPFILKGNPSNETYRWEGLKAVNGYWSGGFKTVQEAIMHIKAEDGEIFTFDTLQEFAQWLAKEVG